MLPRNVHVSLVHLVPASCPNRPKCSFSPSACSSPAARVGTGWARRNTPPADQMERITLAGDQGAAPGSSTLFHQHSWSQRKTSAHHSPHWSQSQVGATPGKALPQRPQDPYWQERQCLSSSILCTHRSKGQKVPKPGFKGLFKENCNNLTANSNFWASRLCFLNSRAWQCCQHQLSGRKKRKNSHLTE